MATTPANPAAAHKATDRKPQLVATLGLQVRTEKLCKICNSPFRGEIEDLLVLRQRGETMTDGVRPTEAWFLANSEGRWGMKLNKANIHTHFSKHFKVGNVTELAKSQRMDLNTRLQKMLQEEGIDAVAPETFLETVVSIAHQRVMADPAAVTVDQGMKAVAELTKRKHDEQTATLMTGLVGAVQAVAQAAGGREPETLVVEDAEVIEDGDTETPEQERGGELGRDEREGSDAEVGGGEEDAGHVPGHQEPPVPGLRLLDSGQERVSAPVPGNKGQAPTPRDVR